MDGLIIKKEWLDMVFHKDKLIEVRSSNTKKRGRIALIESGSKKIIGDAYLYDTFLFKDDKHFDDYMCVHKIKGKMMYKNTWT